MIHNYQQSVLTKSKILYLLFPNDTTNMLYWKPDKQYIKY